MKKLFIITLTIIMGLVSMSTAFAADKSDCIYRSKIDQTINFYQARLYLIDSEYKILSDIGNDAQKTINYLQEKKEQIIQEMKDEKIELSSIKIKNYIAKKAKIGV
ncbi:hypothetical protein [Desulfobacula sp.]